jgi:uncharacterized protein YjbI with pentapeptide repeats
MTVFNNQVTFSGVPPWLTGAIAGSAASIAGGLLKGAGSEVAKRSGDNFLPLKPGELRKQDLTEGSQDITALETLQHAQNYFVSNPNKSLDPLIRAAWSEKVKQAIYQLWKDRKISGDYSNYLLSYKKLRFPGIQLNGLVLEAERPKGSFWRDWQVWKSEEQRIQDQIDQNRKLTSQRVDARTFKARKKAEKKHPPTHRGNLNGLSIPDANVEQSAIIRGRLHNGVLDRLKARGFHLTGTSARELSARDAQIDLSEWNQMGLQGSNLENTEAYGSTFDHTNFGPSASRNLPAANMRKFRVVKSRFSEPRNIKVDSPTTFKQSNLTQVDLQQSCMEEPDMTAAKLAGANVANSQWVAPNFSKTKMAGLLGFESAHFATEANTAPYKRHPILAWALAAASSPVNHTWDNWFKKPLQRIDKLAKRHHKTKRTNMTKADISGLDFASKDLKQFNLAQAQAVQTNFSNAFVGKVPISKIVSKAYEAQSPKNQAVFIKLLKTYLPFKVKRNSDYPILSSSSIEQNSILNLLK